ncbi:MAG: sigma-E processing peptidase SpoIIGA [Christensenellales bacterium]|jgi:stage II sporulation protein GA (sporulation sigma-E factor processing peptidase)
MRVYIELVFLDNLCMNFVILYLASKMACADSPPWRALLSAGLGALYSVAYLPAGNTLLRSFFIKIPLSLLMTLIAFGISKRYLRALGAFYGVTFLLGGAMFGLFYFTGTGVYTPGVLITSGFPLRIALLSCALVMLGLKCYRRYCFRRIHTEKRLRLRLEKTCTLEALLDTGHSLKEPISGHDVIIVDYDDIKHALPSCLLNVFDQGGDVYQATCKLLGGRWESRFRLIPYYTVQQGSVMLALKPYCAELYEDGWKQLKHVYIGISTAKLKKESGYSALLPVNIAV